MPSRLPGEEKCPQGLPARAAVVDQKGLVALVEARATSSHSQAIHYTGKQAAQETQAPQPQVPDTMAARPG